MIDDGAQGGDAGALGLEGLLEWTHARYVARTTATPLRTTAARLDEAHGAILAKALTSPYDEPFADAAAHDGYAVCGEGPWQVVDLAHDVALSQHFAMRVRTLQVLPGHTDAVLARGRGVVDVRDDGTEVLTARDPLTDLPERYARPELGTGIVRQGQIRSAGTELIPAHSIVTPGVLALAAAAGLDTVDVIAPPAVGTLVLGSTLLTNGPPRDGRVRDALGWTIPALLGSLGARANPPLRAPDTHDLLLAEIDDASVDMLVVTGSTSPGGDNILRTALRDIGAHWLIDGISMTPGAQTLLVRLPDGRLLLGLPGDPVAALAGLITLAAPLIAGLRVAALSAPNESAAGDDSTRLVPSRAILTAATPAPDYDDDTTLVPVRLSATDLPAHSAGDTFATALPADGPARLNGWASADAVAVIPPGAGQAGDTVPVLDLLGRPAST